jgi:two-component system, response regulator PdtaR
MSDTVADLPKPTVLLADGDRLVLATLSQVVQNAGFTPVETSTGAAALRHCQENPPGIAVIDYDFADVPGIEIARALRPSTFPLIFLSARGGDEIVRTAADSGAMACLLKPVDPLHLVPTLHLALLRFAELAALRGESAQLNAALKGARATSVVVGMLMERLCLTEKDAYDRLRTYCRSNNRKITDVAAEILGATESLHSIQSALGAMGGKPQGIPGLRSS